MCDFHGSLYITCKSYIFTVQDNFTIDNISLPPHQPVEAVNEPSLTDSILNEVRATTVPAQEPDEWHVVDATTERGKPKLFNSNGYCFTIKRKNGKTSHIALLQCITMF